MARSCVTPLRCQLSRNTFPSFRNRQSSICGRKIRVPGFMIRLLFTICRHRISPWYSMFSSAPLISRLSATMSILRSCVRAISSWIWWSKLVCLHNTAMLSVQTGISIAMTAKPSSICIMMNPRHLRCISLRTPPPCDTAPASAGRFPPSSCGWYPARMRTCGWWNRSKVQRQ